MILFYIYIGLVHFRESSLSFSLNKILSQVNDFFFLKFQVLIIMIFVNSIILLNIFKLNYWYSWACQKDNG